MSRQDLKFCMNAIRKEMPDMRRVVVPTVRGTNSRILIAENSTGNKTVFRFNPRHVAHRNHDISHVLIAHGMAVPRVSLHLYHGQYFETYPYLPGQTFQECLIAGMSHSEILDTYAMMAEQIKKLSGIPVHNFKNIENKNCSAVAQSNSVHKTDCWVLGQCVKYGTKLLNVGDQAICHCDFTPRNIVMGAENKITSVLDLNAVSIANLNFALAITGLSLEHNKLDPYEFYSVCNDILPGKIQPARISLTKQICNLYFRGYCK